MKSRKFPAFAVVIVLCVVLLPIGHAAPPVPDKLTDQQFWNLSKEWSEEDGVYRSHNLLSNEAACSASFRRR